MGEADRNSTAIELTAVLVAVMVVMLGFTVRKLLRKRGAPAAGGAANGT